MKSEAVSFGRSNCALLPKLDHPTDLASVKIVPYSGITSIETRNGKFLCVSTSEGFMPGTGRRIFNEVDIAESIGGHLMHPERQLAEVPQLLKLMAESTRAPRFIPLDISEKDLQKHGLSRVIQAAINIRHAVNENLEIPTDVVVAVRGVVAGITEGATLHSILKKVNADLNYVNIARTAEVLTGELATLDFKNFSAPLNWLESFQKMASGSKLSMIPESAIFERFKSEGFEANYKDPANLEDFSAALSARRVLISEALRLLKKDGVLGQDFLQKLKIFDERWGRDGTGPAVAPRANVA